GFEEIRESEADIELQKPSGEIKEQGKEVESTPIEEMEIIDNNLKENILIRIETSGETGVAEEYSYRYNNTWITNDKNFDKELNYVGGIDAILYRLGVHGKIYVNNKLVNNDFDSVINVLRKE
ncbi:MAG: hypothetical protein AABX77_00975, partial [Nanoarchaeota archaeon]